MNTVLFCVLVFFNIFNDVKTGLAPTNLLPKRIGPCYTSPSTDVTVSEMSLNTRLYDSSLSGELNISMDIEDGWIIKGTMQKCQDIRNLDTCDYFKAFTVISKGCVKDDENSKDQEMNSLFFNHVHPRISCPVKAGNYKIFNYPIFTKDNYLMVAESKISTSVFGYTLRLEGFTDMTRILCVEAYLQLLYIREYNVRIESPSATIEPSSEEERVASEEEGAE